MKRKKYVSQHDLAKWFGLSQPSVCAWLNPKLTTRPRPVLLEDLRERIPELKSTTTFNDWYGDKIALARKLRAAYRKAHSRKVQVKKGDGGRDNLPVQEGSVAVSEPHVAAADRRDNRSDIPAQVLDR